MIKLSLAEIKESEGALQKVLSSPLDVRLAYSLGKLIKKLNEELQNIETIRIKLVDQYGVTSENGSKQVQPDKFTEFYRDYNEALKIEVEFDINKLPLEKLGEVKLSPIEINTISFLIEEPNAQSNG